MATALITGISGQDGSYLAELLLRKGYAVHGVSRRPEADNSRLRDVRTELKMHPTPDMESTAWQRLLAMIRPDEIYHLAADSFVPSGWRSPVENVQSNLSLTVTLLEALGKEVPQARFLNACSREVFGNLVGTTASETTPMQPSTPYGINKAASRWYCQSFRQQYGCFAASAILFNHESPRRGENFVTRKVTRAAARIALGMQQQLEMGSLSAQRDWGFAGDFVDAMWRMLQLDQPEDFVLGTGKLHSVADLVEIAFSTVGLNWREHVVCAEEFVRHGENSALAADCRRAEQQLDWKPQTAFRQLVASMVHHDLDEASASSPPSRRVA